LTETDELVTPEFQGHYSPPCRNIPVITGVNGITSGVMKNKRYVVSKSTKFVRVDNTIWIEADEWIPDEVARMQFLQRMQLTKPVHSPESPDLRMLLSNSENL